MISQAPPASLLPLAILVLSVVGAVDTDAMAARHPVNVTEFCSGPLFWSLYLRTLWVYRSDTPLESLG